VKFALLPWVAAVVFSAGCSKTPSTGATVDSAFRAGISPDVQTLVSINLDRLKTTELYRRHQQLLDLPQFNNLAERAGLDPRRDIASLCVTWDGKHMVLLAKGGFTNGPLEEKLVANGAQRVPYKKFTLLTRGSDSVAFTKPGFAVASSTAAVQSELDLLASNSGTIPEELNARLADVPSDAQIWEVSRGGLPFAGFALRSDLDSALSNFAAFVTGTSFGVRFDSGSHLLSRFLCKSPEGAQRVNDAMRGLIGLARLSTKDNELDMLRMWDAVSISKDQQFVRVRADLPADLSDKLINQIATFRGHAGAVLAPQQ
jgi:hypothetical protein